MRRKLLQTLLDTPSVWCIRLLCALSLIVTCSLAFARSPRTVWSIITSLLLLLLSAVNRLRIHNRIKLLVGIARRPKPARRNKRAEQ